MVKRVSEAQIRRGGMLGRAGGGRTAFNLHNQARPRANGGGGGGAGFTVEFLGEKARQRLDEALGASVIVIAQSSGEALVEETDQTKQMVRSYIDGVFAGSAMHANNHRRVSNAAAQSVYYDDHQGEPALASLIYSKFGSGKHRSFVDYLLLHMRGGTIRPKGGKYLMLANTPVVGDNFKGANIGSFASGDVAMAQSKNRDKLFLIRRPKGGGRGVLLATLLKSLTFAPDLPGVDGILAGRGARFESNFDAVFSRKKSEAGLT